MDDAGRSFSERQLLCGPEPFAICLSHRFRCKDFHFPTVRKYPSKECWALGHFNSDGKCIFIPLDDRHIFAESIYNGVHKCIAAPKGCRFHLLVVHHKEFSAQCLNGIVFRLWMKGGMCLLRGNDAVYPELGNLFVPLRPAYDVVSVRIPNHVVWGKNILCTAVLFNALLVRRVLQIPS